jgi:hypothetical protein
MKSWLLTAAMARPGAQADDVGNQFGLTGTSNFRTLQRRRSKSPMESEIRNRIAVSLAAWAY